MLPRGVRRLAAFGPAAFLENDTNTGIRIDALALCGQMSDDSALIISESDAVDCPILYLFLGTKDNS